MGILNCFCNKNLNEGDLNTILPTYTEIHFLRIKRIQNFYRGILYKRHLSEKLNYLRNNNFLFKNDKLIITNLNYNPSWENGFKNVRTNFFNFSLNKLGRKLELSYLKLFKDLITIETDKPTLRLNEYSQFDTKYEDFFNNYKVIIYKYIATFFNIGKQKDYFDKFVMDIDNKNDTTSIFSSFHAKPSIALDNNAESSLLSKDKTKIQFKHNDIISNADTSIDCFSKIATQNHESIPIILEDNKPYFKNLITSINKNQRRHIEIGLNDYYYSGNFNQTLMRGIGKRYNIISESGNCKSKYYGFFDDNLYNGFGVHVSDNGVIYKGEFRNGKKTGYGKERNGPLLYKGFFLNDVYTGFGEISENDKKDKSIKYTGGFKNGKKEGFGYLLYEDCSRYIGYFKEDKMYYLGLFVWKEGHRYFGSWKDSKMNGYGSYKWVNGDVFTGNYLNDLKEGEGIYYFKCKNSFLKGIWVNGKKNGLFQLIEGKSISKLEYIDDKLKIF